MTFETMKFKIWCIEHYRRSHGLTAPETVDLFNRYGVFDFLELPTLQWQSWENTVMDIDEFIENRSRSLHSCSRFYFGETPSATFSTRGFRTWKGGLSCSSF